MTDSSTDMEKVKQCYPWAGVAKVFTRHGYRYEIVAKPVGSPPRTVSSRCKSEAAAWKSATRRLERERGRQGEGETGRQVILQGESCQPSVVSRQPEAEGTEAASPQEL